MMKRWLKALMGLFVVTSAAPASASGTGRTDTEFTAEVVRITQILPHPNADRLEIARFEMAGLGETAYEVVVQKGTYRKGDLAAYLSVDCIVPLDLPEFAFLKQRPDGEGKTHFRLRAARLRGVYSQGLLVPAPLLFDFGRSVAGVFGITYYRPPMKGESGPTPPGKPKPQPCPVYGVDSLKKMPRLFSAGEPVFVTEKIHGTNFRFGWVRRRVLGIPFGWKFIVGSHHVVKGNGRKGYYGSDLWATYAEREKLKERTRKYKGLVFYGELYGYTYDGARIQDLAYGVLPGAGPQLAVFDIRDTRDNFWYTPFERVELCDELDLDHAPVLAPYEFYGDITPMWWEGLPSTMDSDTVMEGVVVESMSGPRRKAKWVHQAYLLRKGA